MYPTRFYTYGKEDEGDMMKEHIIVLKRMKVI
jgi:hypothetical protein